MRSQGQYHALAEVAAADKAALRAAGLMLELPSNALADDAHAAHRPIRPRIFASHLDLASCKRTIKWRGPNTPYGVDGMAEV